MVTPEAYEEEMFYFNLYCKKSGIKPNDILQQYILEQVLIDLREIITLKEHAVVKDNPTKLSDIESWFNFRRKKFKFLKQTCISTILSLRKHVKTKLSIELYKRTYNNFNLKKRLRNIPIICLFQSEIEFALIKENSNKYFIRNYIGFDSFFSRYFYPIYINSAIQLHKGTFSNKTSKNYNFKEIFNLLFRSIEMLDSENSNFETREYLEKHELTNLYTDEVQYYGQDSYHGLQFFAFYHEYSHYLLKHFDRKDKERSEIEADLLSINLMFQQLHNQYGIYVSNIHLNGYNLISKVIGPVFYFFIKFFQNINEKENRKFYLLRYFYCKDIIEMLSVSQFQIKRGLAMIHGIHNFFLTGIEESGITINQIQEELETIYYERLKSKLIPTIYLNGREIKFNLDVFAKSFSNYIQIPEDEIGNIKNDKIT